jgi:hypothetical protein
VTLRQHGDEVVVVRHNAHGRRWRLLPFKIWTKLGDEADGGAAAVREATIVEVDDGLAQGLIGKATGKKWWTGGGTRTSIYLAG